MNKTFTLSGSVAVCKNYDEDITIPNVPGIDDEGGHDSWSTTLRFSEKEDLLSLIEYCKRPWYNKYEFPLAVVDDGNSASISYDGKRMASIAQVLMIIPSTGCAAHGMDSLANWVCGVVNEVLTLIEAGSEKVSVSTINVVHEPSKLEVYQSMCKVLNCLGDYNASVVDAIKVGLNYLSDHLGLNEKWDVSMDIWDASYELRDFIESSDFDDIIELAKWRDAVIRTRDFLKGIIIAG